MKIIMLLIVIIFVATSCATGVSTYEYQHNADGSTYVKVKSVNEITDGMKMGINRDTGTLEVEIGNMTKKSDTAAVVSSVENIIHDVTNLGEGR